MATSIGDTGLYINSVVSVARSDHLPLTPTHTTPSLSLWMVSRPAVLRHAWRRRQIPQPPVDAAPGMALPVGFLGRPLAAAGSWPEP